MHEEAIAVPGLDYDWNEVYTGEASDYEAPNAQLLSVAEGLEPGRALDVGCGAGGLAIALAERGWAVTGVDIASKAIAAAGKVAKAKGVQLDLHVSDSSQWTPPGRYELVVSSFALPEDAAGRAPTFRMMREALAPGGTVAIEEFDAGMRKHSVFARFELPTPEELAAAFEGFEILRNEVVETPVHDHGQDHSQQGPWTALLFVARAPGA